MAHDDEFYWFQQYSRRPYGARQSIPAARRNPKAKKTYEVTYRLGGYGHEADLTTVDATSAAAAQKQVEKSFGRRATVLHVEEIDPLTGAYLSPQPRRAEVKATGVVVFEGHPRRAVVKAKKNTSMASAAMRLHHDTGMPLKQAWSEVRNNPRRRDSGMPAGTSHGFVSDERDVRFGQHNPGVFGRKKARNNSAAAAMRLHHDTGMSLKQAWQQVRNNPKHRYYSKFSERALPQYEQIFGAFSTGEAVTHGIQPVNRRNPRRSRGIFGRSNPGQHRVIQNRFGDRQCCVTGVIIRRGDDMVEHPTMRGPKGGKAYCVPSALGL